MSGKLWHGILVMYDRMTGSLWTQLDGRAIKGDLAGTRLAHFPSQFTTWAAWKSAHPDTLVLDKSGEEREQTESLYAAYFADPERLFAPALQEGIGGVDPKDVVLGVVVEDQALAVTAELLEGDGVINAVVGKTPIAFLFDDRSRFVRAVDRRMAGRVLIIEHLDPGPPTELVLDAVTGTTQAVDDLLPLRVDRAYWYAWARSHPGSRVIAD